MTITIQTTEKTMLDGIYNLSITDHADKTIEIQCLSPQDAMALGQKLRDLFEQYSINRVYTRFDVPVKQAHT